MNFTTKKLVFAAAIGALYAALTIGLAPISFGAIQARVSEVLCILPFFFPLSALGLTIGCLIANLIGSSAGLLDIVFGSLATLLATGCVAAIGIWARKKAPIGDTQSGVTMGACIAACLMPVLFNAPIIGAVLAFTLVAPEAFWESFVLFGAQVGLGEAIVMLALGLPMLRYLLKSKKFKTIFAG
ncbi:MAG: QueT transporter family protein, partial [Oscillospiraceae bacterium]